MQKLKVGDSVQWMCPLDHDYFDGEIIAIRNKYATIRGVGLYKNTITEVHFRYIKKVAGGKCGGGGKRDR